MQKIVATPAVLASALQSAGGASNAVLRLVAYRRAVLLVSAPLFAEYDAMLKSPERRLGHGRLPEAIDRFLAAVASASRLAPIGFQWRPRMNDVGDEIVLETAVYGGADTIVTHEPARWSIAADLGITVRTPAAFLETMG